jgi:mannose/cellobiose epimerase-like protein (N-acyl-D-glucosamine 2-epimerase family)
MKKSLLIFLAIPLLASGQPYKSPYLANPSLLAGYVDSCAAFWTNVYDAQYGGYFTNVGRTGNVLSNSKNTMNLSRDAYGFVRAYQMTGKQIYLTHARQALQFMYAHSWDSTHGGWYNSLAQNGSPSASTENKTAFYQHYALVGITAMFEATRDSSDWNWLMKGYANNDARFWDSRPSYFGYYDYTLFDGSNPTNKTFNSTVDAVTTHLLHLYLLTNDSKYLTRLNQVASNMKRLVGSMPDNAIGITEGWSSDWGADNSVTMTIMGHVLKTSWCFGRMYHLTKDSTYLVAAEKLAQHVLSRGYDAVNGGPYKDFNRTTGQMLMWGISDTAKAWWQMEQAVTDGLTLYQITGKQQYLTMADETLAFFMNYFVDHIYGEVYSDRTKFGAGIPAWGTNKGNDSKAAYHSIETGYYAYMYQSLMVAKSTASLYYYIAPQPASRTLGFRPLTFPDYRIKDVRLNDTLYASFDQKNSTISFPAGRGGKVLVTYEYYPSTTSVAATPEMPHAFELAQNYPNPANPVTKIRYVLPDAATSSHHIFLAVYDLLGRQVAVLVDGDQQPGRHEVSFDGSRLGSGVYFYRLEFGNESITKKMILLR